MTGVPIIALTALAMIGDRERCLAADRLPTRVTVPAQTGSLLLPALTGPTTVFHETFSGTSYWERQSQHVALPADGHYTVAIWHGAGEVAATYL